MEKLSIKAPPKRLVEMFCDLLLGRFGLIECQREIDPGLEEQISTIIWVTPRLQSDVQELKVISDQLHLKYGREFGIACQSNSLSNVNEKVMEKLSIKAPPKRLVEQYLVEIAKSFDVPYEPEEDIDPPGPNWDRNNSYVPGAPNLIDFNFEKPPLVNPNDCNHPNMYISGPINQPPYPVSDNSYPYPQKSHLPDNTMPLSLPPKYEEFPDEGTPPQESRPPLPLNGPNEWVAPEIHGDSDRNNQAAGSSSVDFDDLNRRFEELKRKP